jgi:hypothetical protein
MAFTVYLSADEGIYHGYGDKDRYELSAAGTLVVRPAGGTETYTYSQWVYLKADTDHTAGGPKSGSGKGRRSSSGHMTGIDIPCDGGVLASITPRNKMT